MKKKLLVTVSAADLALSGPRFLADFIGDKKETGVTLLHVAKNPSLTASEAATGRELGEVMRQKAIIRKQSETLLAKAADLLIRAGFPQENIARKVKFRQFGTVSDIIVEGADGKYDAVVLGHGGLTLLDALLRDSVSKALVEFPAEVPIWINRWPKAGRKNVLVCADGSEASIRAADHAGFMLADEPGHDIHILHVHNPAREEPMEPDAAVAGARAAIMENGVSEDRILALYRRGAGYARIIREETERGAYAAVAVGRTGADLPPWRKLFMGSVTLDLLRNLNAAALWVVH